ncbi:MAG: GCN5-related N-acetyltransferase [Gemmatimonadetes bacterium]|nr:GCN5-related N-acetyltransferase [Gemmatimonadota bacterium]
MSVKRLGPGDEPILVSLATNDAAFDLDGRGGSLVPLDDDAGRRFLANPAVLFWTASDDDKVVGFLYCVVVPLRSGDGREVLLYEIGVRNDFRRHGAGRALLTEMEAWMRANDVGEVWVLADNPVAVEFYRDCGFTTDGQQPTYMTRALPT